MKELKRIVFPVDFSARSRGAAHYVEALAKQFDVAIEMVHVMPPPHYEAISLEVSGPVLAEVLAGREAFAKKQLETFLTDELAGFRVHRTLLDGDPALRLVEFARDREADLIVLPTHGYGPFRRFILGSVTAKVLHDADCPVFTGVHMEGAPPTERIQFRKILVALDLTPSSEKALCWAASMARETGAKLVVAHVSPSIEGRSGEYFDPNWREYFTQAAKTEISDMLKRQNVHAETRIGFGEPAKQVCELAEAEGVDLMVIGRGHATEGALGRLRTHAYAIIRMAPCPVVSI